jgi:hypothetical protein
VKRKTDLATVVDRTAKRETASASSLPSIGQWFWVKSEDWNGNPFEWLGCVVHQGTNYVELHGPEGYRSTHTSRVHINEVETRLRAEPEAERVIAARVNEQRQVIAGLTDELRLLMNKLALNLRPAESETCAISTSVTGDVTSYKKALIAAKDHTVPEIQKKIHEASETMAAWMQATMIPLKASIHQLNAETNVIKKRIFGVELYAGLVEEVAQIAEGAPASVDEPIQLFQRRCYMDEECLCDYDVGGMRFAHLDQFDAWLLRPHNLQRILPHPRCLVAFQVRRKEWENTEHEPTLAEFVAMLFNNSREPDKYTYLYMRNGDNVYRLGTGIDFEEKLFPDIDRSILHAGALYAVMPHNSVRRLATEHEYIETKRLEAEERKARNKLPKADRWRFNSKIPDPTDGWVLWNDDTVYYDDISQYVAQHLEDHNRLALVLQGILDRSQIFTPHPSWKLWVPEDFDRAIKLIHDDSRALTTGTPPDFLAYQAALNASLRRGSTTIGQQDYWLRVEAKRENARNSYYWNRRSDIQHIRYKPQGNPGPGRFAIVQSLSRTRECSYVWQRERLREPRRYWKPANPINCRIAVPAIEVLNLDAYTKGDYHKFYDDPRTRANYLQWASLLLPAEEWITKKT